MVSQDRENGNALLYLKATKQNVRVSRIQARERYWRAVAEIKLFGYGKVRYLGFLIRLSDHLCSSSRF